MTIRRILAALAIGALFGAGLTVADMVNPARVQAFLDVGGAWDPTLAFVLGAALIPAAIAYRVRQRMARPILTDRFHDPAKGPVDARLFGGAALFGVGWGLAGLCPGPALAALALGAWPFWLFVAAMLGGMALYAFVEAQFFNPRPQEPKQWS